MLESLFSNYYEATAMILFGIGFTMLLIDNNVIKKIVGFNFMDTGIYLFLAAKGYIDGRVAPIAVDLNPQVEDFINPIPTGLVLTGIVVSVSVSAFFLALAVRLYKAYHTLDLNVMVAKMQKETGVY